ncbi:MAG TPA: hypothetical protein VGP82_06300 [Ktedonobacterales bacterium]|jgi:hypothetical protein|nr:hypothetical protein [Ktedonobacterales bacterium]
MAQSHELQQHEPQNEGEDEEEERISEVPAGNRMLAALPAEEYSGLLPYLEGFEPPHQFVSYQPDEPISHVYFPASGVVHPCSCWASTPRQ